MTTPTLQQRTVDQEKLRDSLRLEDLKIATPKVGVFGRSICFIVFYFQIIFRLLQKPQLTVKKSEFSHTKSLDFDAQSKRKYFLNTEKNRVHRLHKIKY